MRLRANTSISTMKLTHFPLFRLLAVTCVLSLPAIADGAEENYNVAFSTYLGGPAWEHARDVVTDRQGNIIITGGTAGDGFPVTVGAHDTSYNTGGKHTGGHGNCDAFVAKFDPAGKLLWATYLGGPNYDRAYAVEVDGEDNIIVSGRAGPGFPTTAGTFQPEYGGDLKKKGFYGVQNGFVAKFAPDGQLRWASHVGLGELCRDVAVDAAGNIYVSTSIETNHAQPEPAWFADAFRFSYQRNPSRDLDAGVVKISPDGKKVIWASWLGGKGKDHGNASIRVDARNRPTLYFPTESPDLPTTRGAHSAKHAGGKTDLYLARLSADGSRLHTATYLGGSGNDVMETHSLALTPDGGFVVTAHTDSVDFPEKDGRRIKGKENLAVVKLTPRGSVAAVKMVGGSGGEGPDGVAVRADGAVLVTGETSSKDFPVTANAAQAVFGGGKEDGFLLVLSPDLQTLLYSTFAGGPELGYFRGSHLDGQGNLYGTGAANAKGWPVKNAAQPDFGGTTDKRWGNGDAVLMKLTPATAPAEQKSGRAEPDQQPGGGLRHDGDGEAVGVAAAGFGPGISVGAGGQAHVFKRGIQVAAEAGAEIVAAVVGVGDVQDEGSRVGPDAADAAEIIRRAGSEGAAGPEDIAVGRAEDLGGIVDGGVLGTADQEGVAGRVHLAAAADEVAVEGPGREVEAAGGGHEDVIAVPGDSDHHGRRAERGAAENGGQGEERQQLVHNTHILRLEPEVARRNWQQSGDEADFDEAMGREGEI